MTVNDLFEGITVTPSDTVPQTYVALLIAVTGAVSILNSKGDTIVFPAVPAYTMIRVRCTRVNATGTTSTQIIGLN